MMKGPRANEARPGFIHEATPHGPDMPITPERRAEINRENAQKSTGPRTEEGKAASRRNALKHGLAADTVDLDTPRGAYQARLAYWVDDLRPRNVLENAMVERACRATWKLDRCARYEDAAEAERFARPVSTDGKERIPRSAEARRLGALLMLVLDQPVPPGLDPGPPGSYNPFDDPAGTYRKLCTFPEGVVWLLQQWEHIAPGLPDADGAVAEGPDHFLADCRARAIRLLGLRPDATLAQPVREVAMAEHRRLEALYAMLSRGPDARRRADLALLAPGPDALLLIRYEAAAERELHRSVDTFLKLRKNPELVAPVEAEAEAEEKAEEKAAKTSTRRTPPPSRNEPIAAERLDPDRPIAAARAGSPAGEKRRG
jgi:hypothetical protein